MIPHDANRFILVSRNNGNRKAKESNDGYRAKLLGLLRQSRLKRTTLLRAVREAERFLFDASPDGIEKFTRGRLTKYAEELIAETNRRAVR